MDVWPRSGGQARPARSSSSYARFIVVALSRPFVAVVIDARVDCDDGTFYNASDSITTADPLAVGQAGGEIAVEARCFRASPGRAGLSRPAVRVTRR